MKKLFSISLLCATAFAAPAQAEITGYFEEVDKPAPIKKALAEKVNTLTPNLMGIAKKYANELELTEKQKADIALYTEEHIHHMSVLMHKTAVLEKSTLRNALKGTDKNALMLKVKQTNSLRQEIAQNKLECRDHLRSVLSNYQWKKLVALYKIDHLKPVTVAYPGEGIGSN